MGLDDLVSTESAVIATATAAVFSQRTRETLRRGAVLGVAGALKAGDVVTGAARGVASGVRGQDQAPGTRGSGNSSSSSRRGSGSNRRRSTGSSSRRSTGRSGTSASASSEASQ